MKVRTTMRPDQEIEVSEHEAGELRSQGLLIEDDKPPRQAVDKGKEN
jgi:hypothetical protein